MSEAVILPKMLAAAFTLFIDIISNKLGQDQAYEKR